MLALPIHPVFVYDGKNKPKTKRGKTTNRYTTHIDDELSKNLVGRFCFPFHTAPGEAEAECAMLQKHGLVDAVMSQDADAIMFGSGVTLRDWSKEGTKGNKAPTHVSVLDALRIQERTGLTPDGMVLVALLSGGDYHEGLPGFGPSLACQIAKAGFAADLLRSVREGDESGLQDWRRRLVYELQTNESGYFVRRHTALNVPDDFPDRTVLSYYLDPAVSKVKDLKDLEKRWTQWWSKDIDLPLLRQYTALTFDWMYKGGARKFVRTMAQPLLQDRLKRRRVDAASHSVDSITDERRRFINDGIPELRLRTTPADHVAIDLDAEEENPEFAPLEDEGVESDAEDNAEAGPSDIIDAQSMDIRGKRKRPPWDPRVPEKWWIPQTLLEYGLPHIVEDWQQRQRDIRSDPKSFATRNCRDAPAKRGRGLGCNTKHALPKTLPSALASLATTTNTTNPCGALPVHALKHGDASQISSIKRFFPATRRVDHHKSGPPQIGVVEREVIDLLSDDPPAEAVPNSRQPLHGPGGSASMADSVSDLPSTVTRRKKRSPRKIGKVPTADGNEALGPMVVSLQHQAEALLDSLQSMPSMPSQDSASSDTIPRLKVRRKSRKLVVPRDSLPGTWREIADLSSSNSRISIVNLVDD